jgi:hypothetical protein
LFAEIKADGFAKLLEEYKVAAKEFKGKVSHVTFTNIFLIKYLYSCGLEYNVCKNQMKALK